jgi:hypothetical protein
MSHFAFGNKANIPVFLQEVPVLPEKFSRNTFDAIARSSVPNLSCNSNTKAAATKLIFLNIGNKILILQSFSVFCQMYELRTFE